jgi:AraC family transcriptional regulator
MHLLTFKDRSNLPIAILAEPDFSGDGDDSHKLWPEQSWRCLAGVENDRMTDANILVSRWTDSRTGLRQEKLQPSSGRHVIGVALKATCVKLIRGSSTVFDGPMRAGTLHITGPGKPLTAEFRGPCDFVHFHVSSDYLHECQRVAGLGQPIPALGDLVVRDPLAELLGRTLIASAAASDGVYAECVGQTLVMHVARLGVARQTVNALPKWRLKRVQEYVGAHIEKCISLADLAKVAGLSRMHFAAQFRAATGYRPHDYVLHRRIEIAKEMLSNTDLPLAQIALAVGFKEQSYFSTVFKRLTDETPARWKRAIVRQVPTRNFQKPFTVRLNQDSAVA